VQATLQTLREAVQAQHRLQFDYTDANGTHSQRTVRPLGCFYWGSVWTVAAWCEGRADFRSFRLDRMQALVALEGSTGHFRDEAGKTLADYLRLAAPPDVPAKLSGQG
jgi:predicted DNA-binding transcriptional regulator YafY